MHNRFSKYSLQLANPFRTARKTLVMLNEEHQHISLRHFFVPEVLQTRTAILFDNTVQQSLFCTWDSSQRHAC